MDIQNRLKNLSSDLHQSGNKKKNSPFSNLKLFIECIHKHFILKLSCNNSNATAICLLWHCIIKFSMFSQKNSEQIHSKTGCKPIYLRAISLKNFKVQYNVFMLLHSQRINFKKICFVRCLPCSSGSVHWSLLTSQSDADWLMCSQSFHGT